MSIRDLFTRSQKASSSASQAAPSTNQDVGIEISGTMPDLGNPELNQLAQTLLEMSSNFAAQQSEANARLRQDLASAYIEASSAGASSSEDTIYLPRRHGGGTGLTVKSGRRLPADAAEPATIYLGDQPTDESPSAICLYICLEEGWIVGGTNWARVQLENDWTSYT